VFIEPHLGNQAVDRAGWIEAICGCMFSGKMEELIRRLKRAIIAGQKVEIFKPRVDQRFHPKKIVSHNKNEIQSIPVRKATEILEHATACDVVGIDEAQFFDPAIVDVCNTLANDGKRVIVAGLDMDYEGKPFGPVPNILAVAEFVTKLHAICKETGGLASYSYRLSDADGQVLLGEHDQYEARSRKAFSAGMKKKGKK
jgi:thymidine kinase